MLSARRAAELSGPPAPWPADLRLTVVADEDSLTAAAAGALARDGVRITHADVGKAGLVLVRRDCDQRGLAQVVTEARRRAPAATIVVALPEGQRPDVGLLLAAGADALVFERDLERTLAPTVRAVSAGLLSVPAELRSAVHPPALSHRERQILGLSVAGLTNGQIAGRLHISQSTVKSHLAAAFRRLGVHSRREAAALVFAADDQLRRTLLSSLRLADAVSRGEDS
jgi:DNA-binding NarL/FixJ family response regulator